MTVHTYGAHYFNIFKLISKLIEKFFHFTLFQQIGVKPEVVCM